MLLKTLAAGVSTFFGERIKELRGAYGYLQEEGWKHDRASREAGCSGRGTGVGWIGFRCNFFGDFTTRSWKSFFLAAQIEPD